jgi:hypothetical protein
MYNGALEPAGGVRTTGVFVALAQPSAQRKSNRKVHSDKPDISRPMGEDLCEQVTGLDRDSLLTQPDKGVKPLVSRSHVNSLFALRLSFKVSPFKKALRNLSSLMSSLVGLRSDPIFAKISSLKRCSMTGCSISMYNENDKSDDV